MSATPSAPRGDLPRGRARAYLCLLLVAASVLFATGIGWGMPDWRGWAADELHPDSWKRAVTPETHTGWHARYPPLQFSILHHLSQPLRWAMAEGGPLERNSWDANVTLVFFARWVSVAMALATLFVVYLLGRRLAGGRRGRQTGLFAAAIMALTAPYVYYAKMGNLEAPYLLWIALSYLFFLRLVEPGGEGFGPPRLRDAVLFGLAAAATIATKDQAYALYALAPLPVLVSLARWQEGGSAKGDGEPTSRGGRLLRALVDRRFLAAGAAAALGYALFQNLLFNGVRFEHHVELLLGPMSGPYREFGHGLGDQLHLAYRFVQQLVWSLDPFLFLAGVSGVVWVFARNRRSRLAEPRKEAREEPATQPPVTPDRRERWLLASLLTLGASYYLTLIAVIGFTFDRYVLPVTMILALAGGRFFSLLLERADGWAPARWRLARGAISAVFVFAVFYASSVDTRMLVDSRYGVEDFVAQRVGADALRRPQAAVGIGRPKHVPRFRQVSWPQVHRSQGRVLASLGPHFVAISLSDLRSPRERAFVARLDSGELGYLRVLTHRGDPAWNLLYLGDRFGDPNTNQRFVNPEFAVWERIPGSGDATPGAQPPSSADGDSGAGGGSSASGGSR